MSEPLRIFSKYTPARALIPKEASASFIAPHGKNVIIIVIVIFMCIMVAMVITSKSGEHTGR